jgi:UDP-N-acetyl-2-amino-2-deoxyglucuronate dehydrogenase
MSKKLKIGIIGCGRIGARHAGHIQRLAELVAVCDVKIDQAASFGKQYNVPVYTELSEMLAAHKEMDVVAICTPNGFHAQHSIAVLKAGFHVLCEKPMAISLYDCGEMIKTAESANKRLFVVKQNRFNPAVAELKKVIDQGRLGKIMSIQLNCFWNRNFNYYQNSDWKGSKNLDGGTLYTQFSHFIDLMYWMIGDVDTAYAMIGNFAHQDVIEFEDTGVVTLKFHSGALGTINYTVNSYAKNMEGSLTVFGDKGTVKVGGQYLNKLEYQSIDGYEIGAVSEGNPANEYGDYQGSMSNHDKVYENLIDVLQNGAEISANGFEGLKTVEIIEKIYKSAKQNA